MNLTGQVALVTGASRCKALAPPFAARSPPTGRRCVQPLAHVRRGVSLVRTPTEPDELARELTTLGVRTARSNGPQQSRRRCGCWTKPRCVSVRSASWSTTPCIRPTTATSGSTRRRSTRTAVNMRARCSGGGVRPPLRRGRRGRIINITPARGSDPCQTSRYGATKGLSRRSHAVSPAVAPKGITVNAVNPGPTDSGFTPQLRDVLYRGSQWDGSVRLQMPRVWWRGWRARTRAG